MFDILPARAPLSALYIARKPLQQRISSPMRRLVCVRDCVFSLGSRRRLGSR